MRTGHATDLHRRKQKQNVLGSGSERRSKDPFRGRSGPVGVVRGDPLTMSASYERLLKLAHQRAIDGKGGLAASIAKMCLDARADLTPEELALTFEILRQLIDKVEVQIRRYIADYLAERSDVPADMLHFLANDVINVAYPILVHSRQLTEDDLLAVVESRGRQHAVAVARRSGLSERLSGRLVETGDIDVMLQLLKNFTAQIGVDAYAAMARRSILEENLQAPLLHRRDLPPEIARRMYSWVGGALREYIMQNFKIAPDVLDKAVDQAVEKAFVAGIDEAVRAGVDGADHAQRLLGGLDRSGDVGFMGAFAELTGLEMATVSDLFRDGAVEPIAIACKAFGLSTDQFQSVLNTMLSERRVTEMNGGGGFKGVLRFYQRIDSTSARLVVSAWRGREGHTVN